MSAGVRRVDVRALAGVALGGLLALAPAVSAAPVGSAAPAGATGPAGPAERTALPAHASLVREFPRVEMQVSPARIEAVVSSGSLVGPLQVTNTGNAPIRVHVTLGWTGHDREGVPRFDESEGAVQRAEGLLELWPREAELPAGQSLEIHGRVRPEALDLPGRESAYPAIFVEAWPAEVPLEQLTQRNRVAVVALLRWPGSQPGRAEIVDVEVHPGGDDGTLRLVAEVANRGGTHVVPIAAVEVRNQAGQPVAYVPLEPAVILPGHSRRLYGSWSDASLAPGAYALRAEVSVPGEPAAVATAAFLIGPGHEVALVSSGASGAVGGP